MNIIVEVITQKPLNIQRLPYFQHLVETKRIELSTLRMRTVRSPS